MPRKTLSFEWKQDLNLSSLKEFEPAFYLNSNHTNKKNLLALGELKRISKPSFEALDQFQKENNDWLFGYISYDAKNQLEELESKNPASHSYPDMDFVIPELVLEWFGNSGKIHYKEENTSSVQIESVLNKLMKPIVAEKKLQPLAFQPQVSKKEYLKKVNELKDEIQYGNIYEINYCQEFYANKKVDPYLVYKNLNTISPTPYSCFVHINNFFLMCASPEQYLEKKGKEIISRPIKGTIKRNADVKRDNELKIQLYNSEKDRAENVMIVDLVRNDLSKCAEKGSVKVDELFGIYSFPQVHQMISTVSAKLKGGMSGTSALKNTFPMGSMTGAPKIKAMQLIEKEEAFKRGLYAGTVGYFNPDGDFNFNVVIRSLFYSPKKELISFAVGGAITDGSDALDEYQESLLKAKAIFDLFKSV